MTPMNDSDTRYTYHIEDGQFSFDFTCNRLLGKEGQIIEYPTDRNGDDEFYILFIDGTHVECIGNIERSYPKNTQEHEYLRKLMQEAANAYHR